MILKNIQVVHREAIEGRYKGMRNKGNKMRYKGMRNKGNKMKVNSNMVYLSTDVSITTLNVNHINALIKRYWQNG